MTTKMKYTHVWTPTTLAAMIANLSQYLAEQYDGVADEEAAGEWDAAHADSRMGIRPDDCEGMKSVAHD